MIWSNHGRVLKQRPSKRIWVMLQVLSAEPLCLVSWSGDSGCTILFPQEVHLSQMFVLWLLRKDINPACSYLLSDCGSAVVQYEPDLILCCVQARRISALLRGSTLCSVYGHPHHRTSTWRNSNPTTYSYQPSIRLTIVCPLYGSGYVTSIAATLRKKKVLCKHVRISHRQGYRNCV
jgi:hypothetical protein